MPSPATADYDQIVKAHRSEHSGGGRYAPNRVQEVRRHPICLLWQRMTTSYLKRHNWTLRGINRRMKLRSNGFSRKLENLEVRINLGYFDYTLVKPHRSLGGATPGMAMGAASRP